MSRRASRAALSRYDEGKALYDQGKYDEAIAAYRAAVEKDPEMSLAWHGIYA